MRPLADNNLYIRNGIQTIVHTSKCTGTPAPLGRPGVSETLWDAEAGAALVENLTVGGGSLIFFFIVQPTAAGWALVWV